jgi:hypothetical protein
VDTGAGAVATETGPGESGGPESGPSESASPAQDTAGTGDTWEPGGTETGLPNSCELADGSYVYDTGLVRTGTCTVPDYIWQAFDYVEGLTLSGAGDGVYTLFYAGIPEPASCTLESTCELSCEGITGDASVSSFGYEGARVTYAMVTDATVTGPSALDGHHAIELGCTPPGDVCDAFAAELLQTELPCEADFAFVARLAAELHFAPGPHSTHTPARATPVPPAAAANQTGSRSCSAR